jgi:hypothetical protein
LTFTSFAIVAAPGRRGNPADDEFFLASATTAPADPVSLPGKIVSA